MSNFIPSALSKSGQATVQDSDQAARLPAVYQDCQACRISGTLTFSAVGVYAIVQARRQAKTRVGQAAATLAGLGAR